MPIVNQPQPPAPATGAGETLCVNCQQPITPCQCHPFCNAPFMGHIHVKSHSHLCGFPRLAPAQPGATEPDVALPAPNFYNADKLPEVMP